ncbi:arsenical pump-driving ATPase [Dietzia sp. SLG310A2-38A2]|uniref:arsenical pump-driving ATPase n=1 Tax=Dietzia sp. SLG310A2-38A2 TaxID=1630643 RepID=UPI0015F918F4|nr:arsenical pump-driving ATPase [Dietzia sp. SLG310A2-38A2]MBB1030253.1 arsenical pump-driving ATPase [Dietzia sp. SLG310A2-38A2]
MTAAARPAAADPRKVFVNSFLDDPARYVFFTGKGGVGKTSLACATAVRLCRAGARVLLVSTDPASNVGQVFGQRIGNRIVEVGVVPGLSAMEIEPDAAAEAYRERVVGPVRGLLPEAEITAITEQLSGSCTTEIASFNEFTALLTDPGVMGGYDHIVFDTAPTGHTIRLLTLPGSWTDFLERGKGDASCLGPMAGLDKQRAVYADAVARLADPATTRLVLVARPQTSSLDEIARTSAELADVGMHNQSVVVNGVLAGPHRDDDDEEIDPIAEGFRQRQREALDAMPDALRRLPVETVPLRPENLVGVPALERLFEPAEASTASVHAVAGAPAPHTAPLSAPLSDLVDQIESDGHGLVMTMGKGGVGKTTVAAAVAVELAARGNEVHLTTTDPAAHLTDTVAGEVPGLTVSRIDPEEASADYRRRVVRGKGANLDEAGLAALDEDLRSPCTEEVAVFQAFSGVIHESRHRFVVVDTAPTGHTLLLLDATGSYHREIARQMGDGGRFTTPLMRLQDPAQTKILIVTLAETTPVLEAAALQADLRRAGIEPWAWVVNNALAASGTTDAVLRRRAELENEQLGAVRGGLAERLSVVPYSAEDPVGPEALRRLASGSASGAAGSGTATVEAMSS